MSLTRKTNSFHCRETAVKAFEETFGTHLLPRQSVYLTKKLNKNTHVIDSPKAKEEAIAMGELYFGTLSRKTGTVLDQIDDLLRGLPVVPGEFIGTSRTYKKFVSIFSFAMDGDEFNDKENYPSHDAIIKAYPELAIDTFASLESVNSMEVKYEDDPADKHLPPKDRRRIVKERAWLRLRIIIVLPLIITEGEMTTPNGIKVDYKVVLKAIKDYYCAKYPFIAGSTATDVTRLSFGNKGGNAYYYGGGISEEKLWQLVEQEIKSEPEPFDSIGPDENSSKVNGAGDYSSANYFDGDEPANTNLAVFMREAKLHKLFLSLPGGIVKQAVDKNGESLGAGKYKYVEGDTNLSFEITQGNKGGQVAHIFSTTTQKAVLKYINKESVTIQPNCISLNAYRLYLLFYTISVHNKPLDSKKLSDKPKINTIIFKDFGIGDDPAIRRRVNLETSTNKWRNLHIDDSHPLLRRSKVSIDNQQVSAVKIITYQEARDFLHFGIKSLLNYSADAFMARKEKVGIGKSTELSNQVVVLQNKAIEYTGSDIDHIPGFVSNSNKDKRYGTSSDQPEHLKPYLIAETPTTLLRDNLVQHLNSFSVEHGYEPAAGAYKGRATKVDGVYTMCSEYENLQLPLVATKKKGLWGCKKCPKWDNRFEDCAYWNQWAREDEEYEEQGGLISQSKQLIHANLGSLFSTAGHGWLKTIRDIVSSQYQQYVFLIDDISIQNIFVDCKYSLVDISKAFTGRITDCGTLEPTVTWLRKFYDILFVNSDDKVEIVKQLKPMVDDLFLEWKLKKLKRRHKWSKDADEVRQLQEEIKVLEDKVQLGQSIKEGLKWMPMPDDEKIALENVSWIETKGDVVKIEDYAEDDSTEFKDLLAIPPLLGDLKESNIFEDLSLFFNHASGHIENSPLLVDLDKMELTFTHKPVLPNTKKPCKFILNSATINETILKNCFSEIGLDVEIGGMEQIALADGVKVFQYQNAKLTLQNVLLRDDITGKNYALTEQAKNDLTHICKIVEKDKKDNEMAVFISHKEFDSPDFYNPDDITEEEFKERGLDIVQRIRELCRVITYDTAYGLNLEQDGKKVKQTILYGAPKCLHEVIMQDAPKVFMADKEPLPKGDYDQLTEKDVYTANGISIDEIRYIDTRYEILRHDRLNNKMIQAAGRARPYTKEDSTILIWSTADLGDLTAQAAFIDRDILYNSEDYTDMQNKVQERQDQIDLDQQIRNGRMTLKGYMLDLYRNGERHLSNLVSLVNAKMEELQLPGKKLKAADINAWLEYSGFNRLQTNTDIVYNFLKENGPKRTRQITITLSKRFPYLTAAQRSNILQDLKRAGKVRLDRKKFWHVVK